MMSRRSAGSLGWVVLLVVGVVPLALDRDSFPLSTYPMFSSRRSTSEPVDTAVGVTGSGTVVRLTPEEIAGTDEIIIATEVVASAIASGESQTLCSEIVRRLHRSGITEVDVVTEVFDAVQWYRHRRQPIRRDVHARCETA